MKKSDFLLIHLAFTEGLFINYLGKISVNI